MGEIKGIDQLAAIGGLLCILFLVGVLVGDVDLGFLLLALLLAVLGLLVFGAMLGAR